MLRGISQDGKYVAHTACYISRNAAGEAQLHDSIHDAIAKPTWLTGLVQAIQSTNDGEIKVLVSQFANVSENRGPFSKPIRNDVENRIYATSGVPVVRLPTLPRHMSSGDHIYSTTFGERGKLRVIQKTRGSARVLTEVDIDRGRKGDAFQVGRDIPDDWRSAEGKIVLPSGKGVINLGLLRLGFLAPGNAKSRRLDERARDYALSPSYGKGGSTGGLALGHDGKSIIARYREGPGSMGPFWQDVGNDNAFC